MNEESQQKELGVDMEQDDATFIPQVKRDLIPKVSQEFQSPENALDFYNKYAGEAGFSTRIGNARKNKETEEVIWKMFVCYKKYLDHKNSLIDFITRFNRALLHQRHEELVANHNDCNEVPNMVTSSPMEQKMSSIYTKKLFLLFQKELQESMAYTCTLISTTCENKMYMVKRFELEKTFNRQRRLTYHISSDSISCSCKLFEFEGYSCRHMLCWMKVMQVMMLPDKYIVERWTKKAKIVVAFEQTPNLAEGQSFLSRRIALTRTAMELVDDCCLTEARSDFLMGELQNLMVKIKDIDCDSNTGKQHSKSREFTNTVRDPNVVRTKGCGKRIKSSKEKAMSQSSRSCSICGRGGHNKRKCPDLNSMSQANEPYDSEYSYDGTQEDGYMS